MVQARLSLTVQLKLPLNSILKSTADVGKYSGESYRETDTWRSGKVVTGEDPSGRPCWNSHEGPARSLTGIEGDCFLGMGL